LIKTLNRQELIDKIEMFINKNKLSLIIAKNRYPGGEKTINLCTFTKDDIPLDVAELTIKHSKESGKSYYGNFILVKLSDRFTQVEKSKTTKEVDTLNQYLASLSDD
jgi:hypothetical protein